ncbi:hypothetical protein Nepgr_023821 [Nepenthes gracilis]|uniref:Uncharacterized protein n=1 Tax=Nepenthes gracilis TaxID=150966 RepID=A0AAD3T1M9_NEPGR|nr:hypothetical protein Nepgr_023821 [Nepenthes gracilis]
MVNEGEKLKLEGAEIALKTRTWRPNDALWPQSLSNLSNQSNFKMNSKRCGCIMKTMGSKQSCLCPHHAPYVVTTWILRTRVFSPVCMGLGFACCVTRGFLKRMGVVLAVIPFFMISHLFPLFSTSKSETVQVVHTNSVDYVTSGIGAPVQSRGIDYLETLTDRRDQQEEEHGGTVASNKKLRKVLCNNFEDCSISNLYSRGTGHHESKNIRSPSNTNTN